MIDFSQCSTNYNHSKDTSFIVKYPNPSFEGYFMAFGSIMFAFGGASTFPTIQADMKDKSKFKFAAYIAMAGRMLTYFYPISYFVFLNSQFVPNKNQ